jgi:hypothetical protein
MDNKFDISNEIEIDVEDDTPEDDRNRAPLPEDIVKEIESDELEDYSEKVKVRLKQMKKVWHDERRAKEESLREREQAIVFAQKILEENKQLKAKVSTSETALVSQFKESAGRQFEDAKQEYKDAFESGDAERLVEAQQKLTSAKQKLDQTERFKPTPLQTEEKVVQPEPVTRDQKAVSWQERNQWFGKNRQMTSLALGLHEELVDQHGPSYATTDEYYQRIDKTMRDKFPEEFKTERPAQKSIVAPATRSTSPKKVVLKVSQLNIAKKLGLTPEQYAQAVLKMES